jgi:hypothetical protein
LTTAFVTVSATLRRSPARPFCIGLSGEKRLVGPWLSIFAQIRRDFGKATSARSANSKGTWSGRHAMEVRSTESSGDDVLLLRLGRRRATVAATPDPGATATDPIDDTVQGYPIGRGATQNRNPAR